MHWTRWVPAKPGLKALCHPGVRLRWRHPGQLSWATPLSQKRLGKVSQSPGGATGEEPRECMEESLWMAIIHRRLQLKSSGNDHVHRSVHKHGSGLAENQKHFKSSTMLTIIDGWQLAQLLRCPSKHSNPRKPGQSPASISYSASSLCAGRTADDTRSKSLSSLQEC